MAASRTDLYEYGSGELSDRSWRPQVSVAAVTACDRRWRWHNPAGFRPVLNWWLVLAGQGSWRDTDRHYDLVPGDCFLQRLWRPCWGAASARSGPTVVWANFGLQQGAEAVDLVAVEHRLPAVHRRIDDAGLVDLLSQLGQRMTEAFNDGSQAKADDYLSCIWHEIMRYDQGQQQTRHDPRIARVRRRIDRNPERPWAVSAMAAECGVSVGQFSRRFKHQVGQAPRAYVQQARLARAKALLRMSDIGIAELAERLGYADIFHFSRRFRQHVGLSPTAYRQGRNG